MAHDFRCRGCGSRISPRSFNTPGMIPCPSCGTRRRMLVFPARLSGIATGRAPEAVMGEGESGCFFHPEKKAVIPCASCGRFLCALCDMDLDGRHLCPACLEQGKNEGSIASLENRRFLYDALALRLALYPMLLFYFTIFTAPVALFIAVRYWSRPTSVVSRTRRRYILAIVISGLQIAAWAAFITVVMAGKGVLPS